MWPALILVFNETHDILELNPAAEEFFSMLTAKQTLLELILPEDHALLFQSLSKLGPGETAGMNLTFLNHDLQQTQFKVTVSRQAQQSILYLMATNIQEFHDRERALVQKQEGAILESRLLALSEMAQGLAHEINNPLGILLGNVALLERELKASNNDSQRMHRITQQISIAGSRVATIVKGLSKICKSENGNPMSLHSLKGLLEQVLLIRRESLKAAGISLILPDFEDQDVACHSAQFMQALINLLDNSIEAVQELPERWIQIEVKKIFEMSEISIVDSGSGIRIETQDKIMQPFFTTKEVGQGMGLGLNISKAIIESHHGRIYYDKNCPHTRFVIQLPLREGASLVAISADDAIGAHLAWRQRLLQNFIAADFTLEPKIIAQDNKCSLGMWIYGSDSRYGHMPCFQKLKKIHAQFHQCTARFVQAQQEKLRTPSEDLRSPHRELVSKDQLAEGSEFDLLSKEIVSLIRLVKNHVEINELDVHKKVS